MPFFRSLVEHHNPDMIVLPPQNNMAGTGRNRFLRAMTIELARQPNIVTSFSRRDIQAAFGTLLNMERPNKDVTMQALVKWFPKLLPYLPKPRRAWDSEDYWVPMFDAVSLAVKAVNTALQRDSASGNGIDVVLITEKEIKRVMHKELVCNL